MRPLHLRRDDAVKLGWGCDLICVSPVTSHPYRNLLPGGRYASLFRSITGQPGWYQYSCVWGGATVTAPPARGKLTLREGWRGLTPACPAACSPPRPPLCLRRRVTVIVTPAPPLPSSCVLRLSTLGRGVAAAGTAVSRPSPTSRANSTRASDRAACPTSWRRLRRPPIRRWRPSPLRPS